MSREAMSLLEELEGIIEMRVGQRDPGVERGPTDRDFKGVKAALKALKGAAARMGKIWDPLEADLLWELESLDDKFGTAMKDAAEDAIEESGTNPEDWARDVIAGIESALDGEM